MTPDEYNQEDLIEKIAEAMKVCYVANLITPLPWQVLARAALGVINTQHNKKDSNPQKQTLLEFANYHYVVGTPGEDFYNFLSIISRYLEQNI